MTGQGYFNNNPRHTPSLLSVEYKMSSQRKGYICINPKKMKSRFLFWGISNRILLQKKRILYVHDDEHKAP